MAENVIDRLVSSLAAGLMGTEEFIDAIESRVSKTCSAGDGAADDGSCGLGHRNVIPAIAAYEASTP